MPNIKFSYLYRDGGNNKKFNSLVFTSRGYIDLIKFESLIRSKLIDGVWFHANIWDLPDLHFNDWDNDLDHQWHEFDGVEFTDEKQNLSYDLSEFKATIEKTPQNDKF